MNINTIREAVWQDEELRTIAIKYKNEIVEEKHLEKDFSYIEEFLLQFTDYIEACYVIKDEKDIHDTAEYDFDFFNPVKEHPAFILHKMIVIAVGEKKRELLEQD